jgi:hypothetical protein
MLLCLFCRIQNIELMHNSLYAINPDIFGRHWGTRNVVDFIEIFSLPFMKRGIYIFYRLSKHNLVSILK